MRSPADTAHPSSNATDTVAGILPQLVGAWKLVSAENYVDGSWVPAFGTPPSGYFIYTASGYASVQIMTTPPVAVTAPDPQNPGQTQQYVSEFLSYYGPWSATSTTITVMAEGNLDPTGVGQPQPRPYQLKDADTLIIGDQTTYIRTLKRM